jgi:hypothetical protein
LIFCRARSSCGSAISNHVIMSTPIAAAPDVWLPKNINFYASMVLALGQFDMRYLIDYTDYKLAETSSRIK